MKLQVKLSDGTVTTIAVRGEQDRKELCGAKCPHLVKQTHTCTLCRSLTGKSYRLATWPVDPCSPVRSHECREARLRFQGKLPS